MKPTSLLRQPWKRHAMPGERGVERSKNEDFGILTQSSRENGILAKNTRADDGGQALCLGMKRGQKKGIR